MPWAQSAVGWPMPVPLTGIAVGTMLKSFAMFRVPVLAPVPVGANTTLIVQVPPGDKGDEEAQSSDSEKSPAVPTLIISSGPLPAFVTVSCCGELLAPTFWLPKSRDTGDTVIVCGGTVTGMLS